MKCNHHIVNCGSLCHSFGDLTVVVTVSWFHCQQLDQSASWLFVSASWHVGEMCASAKHVSVTPAVLCVGWCVSKALAASEKAGSSRHRRSTRRHQVDSEQQSKRVRGSTASVRPSAWRDELCAGGGCCWWQSAQRDCQHRGALTLEQPLAVRLMPARLPLILRDSKIHSSTLVFVPVSVSLHKWITWNCISMVSVVSIENTWLFKILWCGYCHSSAGLSTVTIKPVMSEFKTQARNVQYIHSSVSLLDDVAKHRLWRSKPSRLCSPDQSPSPHIIQNSCNNS